jgi:hypothetical protein
MKKKNKINRYSHAIHKCIRDHIASFKNALSQNPNIVFDIVKESIDKPWDWSALSRNPNILLSIADVVNIVKIYHFA